MWYDVPGRVEAWHISTKTASKRVRYRLQTRTVERLNARHQTVLAAFLGFRKPLYSCIEGMCNIHEHFLCERKTPKGDLVAEQNVHATQNWGQVLTTDIWKKSSQDWQTVEKNPCPVSRGYSIGIANLLYLYLKYFPFLNNMFLQPIVFKYGLNHIKVGFYLYRWDPNGKRRILP